MDDFADLDVTRAFLGGTSNPLRDVALASITREVTERMCREIGVRWSGEDGLATVRYSWGRGFDELRLPYPAVSIIAVVIAGDELEEGVDYLPSEPNPLTGSIEALREVSGAGWPGALVAVRAIWADRPGGDPPAAITGFASWAVAELWRKRNAPAGALLNQEGATFSPSDPWASDDWKRLLGTYAVRPISLAGV